MSGVTPMPFMLRPLLVSHLDIVSLSKDWSSNTSTSCTVPLPKVVCPMIVDVSRSWSDPATISEAEADPSLTKITDW